MLIKPLRDSFIMPTKGSSNAAAFDIYMPEAGTADCHSRFYSLGFAAAIPVGHVGLLLPRSGVGAKHGVELNNTCGVIDADFRGEWRAAIRTKDGLFFSWEAGERLLQCVVVPVLSVNLVLTDELDPTDRGDGGFGSSGV